MNCKVVPPARRANKEEPREAREAAPATECVGVSTTVIPAKLEPKPVRPLAAKLGSTEETEDNPAILSRRREDAVSGVEAAGRWRVSNGVVGSSRADEEPRAAEPRCEIRRRPDMLRKVNQKDRTPRNQ